MQGYPKAGEMRLVSMDRQEAEVDGTNLIRNGDFKQWWAGAPVPNGFSQPAEAVAKVEQLQSGDVQGLGQVWLTPDRERLLDAMLRTESAPLEEGKSYELEVTAASVPGRVASLSLWSRGPEGWVLMADNFLTLQPQNMGLKTYRKAFTATTSGPVAVAASSSGVITEDAVAWLEWRLTAAGGAAS